MLPKPELSAGLACLLALLLCVCGQRACAQTDATVGNGGPGPVKATHLTVEMVTAGPQIARGGQQTVGFIFAMEEGWHVFWRNAGAAGYPPKVAWKVPAGITTGPLQFPTPDRIPVNNTVDYGYEDSVAYPVTVTADRKAKPDKVGNIHLAATVSWLVCKQVCIPGRADLGLDLKLAPVGADVTHQGEQVGELGNAMHHMPGPPPPDFALTATSNGRDLYLLAKTGNKPPDAEFYPWDKDMITDTAVQPIELLADGAHVHLELAKAAKAWPRTLHGLLKFSGDEAYEINVPIVPGPRPAMNPGSTGPAASAQSLAVFSAVGLAFAGGILLNLMPSVFPVLFLKLLALVRSGTDDRRRLRSHGAAYTLGVVASFWLVVAVLLALRAGGRQLAWGFQLQSPGFVAVMAMLLFFFALSLIGVFDLGLSLTITSVGRGVAQQDGYSGSFFTGVLATVVSTPCVGPFVGAAFGYALSQPAAVTLLVFTSLALGLAAPYLLLSLQPAWVRLLPNPGAWMELLQRIAALPLLASVVWLVYRYGRLSVVAGYGVSRTVWLLASLMLVAVAAWVLGRWSARRESTTAAILLAAAAVALPFAVAAAQSQP